MIKHKIIEISVCGKCNHQLSEGAIYCSKCLKKDPEIKYEHFIAEQPEETSEDAREIELLEEDVPEIKEFISGNNLVDLIGIAIILKRYAEAINKNTRAIAALQGQKE